MNLFFNEELNQQIKALLVNNYLQPLSKNLEDVRMKINGPLEGVCNESRKYAESLSELVIKTLRVPPAPLPPGQFPKKYAALSELIDSIQLYFRDHQNAVTRESGRKLVHYLKVIGFAGNAASHREGPVPVSKYDKICCLAAVLECARVVSMLVNPNTVPQQQAQQQYAQQVVPQAQFVQSQQGYQQGHQSQHQSQASFGQASVNPAESNVLLISNIAPGVDENLLAATVLSIVDVLIVKCSVKEKNGYRRAFLHLKDNASAKLARDALDGKVIKNQKIKVQLHAPKPKQGVIPQQHSQPQLVQSQHSQPQMNFYAQQQQPQQPVQFLPQVPSHPFLQQQQQQLAGSQSFGGTVTLVLPKQERDVYALKFRQMDPFATGKVSGGTARPTFEAFGLSYTDLAKIWDIADKDKDGNLTEDEFVTAMALLSAKKAGKIQEVASNYNIIVN
jgi:hypothetical protein